MYIMYLSIPFGTLRNEFSTLFWGGLYICLGCKFGCCLVHVALVITHVLHATAGS